MEIAGYIAAALIGISLGLVGGGGSIFTMPILVYLFGVSPPLATSYSLFVVGSTSLVGAFNNYKKGFINIRAALQFGLSSIITVFLARKFLVPVLLMYATAKSQTSIASFETGNSVGPSAAAGFTAGINFKYFI